tara:strand:- start:1 stop:246 length:246 start_codon:yes stop_codon:yes gene_type:complete
MGHTLRKGSLTVSGLICHLVWGAKCRDKVLKGDKQKLCCQILIQICEAESGEVESGETMMGVESYDFAHIHVENAPWVCVS